MKASNYWQKRFEQLKRDELLATNGSLEQTRKLYDRIERSIEKDLAYWYGRYMKNNEGVSYADAQKALAKKELAEFRWTVEEYIEKAKKLELSPEWQKALENASIKVHVTRLESLKLQLKHHSEVLHDTLNKNLGKDLRKVYEGQYYKNLFEIQKGLGQGRLIEAIDPSFLDLVIHRPWHKDGLDFSARVWQSRDKLASTLERELTYIAIRGDSPDGAIRRISQLFGKSRSHSAMLVQTEHAAMASRAQEDAFKALDVEQFEYIATLDGKTSELCQSMDGKHFPMSEYQVGLTAPPLHPRCRSCTAPYFEDMEAPRWARDKDGKGYVITKDLRYNEWEDSFVKSVKGSYGYHNYRLNKSIVMPTEFIQANTIPEDIRNGITNAIENIQKEYNIKIGIISCKDISSQGKIPFQFNPIKDGHWFKSEFIINSGYDWNDSLEELNDRIYNKNYINGKLSSQNLENLIQHEMAHFMTFQDCDTWTEFITREILIRKKYIEGLSLYNSLSHDGAETIAEGFVAIKNGDKVPEEVLELVNEYIERWKK